MNIIALLESFIYLAASSLHLPMALLLSLLTVRMVIYSGSFTGMYLSRSRLPRSLDAILSLKTQSFSDFPVPVRRFCQQLVELTDHDSHKHHELAVLNLLRETEHRLWKSLDHLKMAIRIGPGLGLIGTLIPMGTGLASLSSGDFTRLSSNLVVAFTTTVVGMTLGLVSYFFFTVQRRWVEEDVKNMELAAEILAGKQ
ncbi:MAG: MotA/TolQ/ExbB proton channel family protein [Desulfocapsaceae bacterium]|nr:MotA/TolQ/ExbB proton channel family protein [Desulfocapsaceae bacterium]